MPTAIRAARPPARRSGSAGARAPLVGRVSMDMLTVDLSAVPDAEVGSAVELWGPHIPVDELAESVGTVGYELLSGLPARVREAAACG